MCDTSLYSGEIMWIENVSRDDIRKGWHYDAGPNSMLIQICDPDNNWPIPKYKFRETRKFKFWDEEDKNLPDTITEFDAERIAKALQHALDNKMNVIVHSEAGLCRSGAVVEVGVMMGFQDTEKLRIPNVLVKTMIANCVF